MRGFTLLIYVLLAPILGMYVWSGARWYGFAVIFGFFAAFSLIQTLSRWTNKRWAVARGLSNSVMHFGLFGVIGFVFWLAMHDAAHEFPKLFGYPDYSGWPGPADGSLNRLLAMVVCYYIGIGLSLYLTGYRGYRGWMHKDAPHWPTWPILGRLYRTLSLLAVRCTFAASVVATVVIVGIALN